MRLCTGQHKETKWLHRLQGPTIQYEKDKDISPSARDPPGAKQAVFMLELQFLLKPFHCEGQDDFFNITEHKVNKVFSRNKTSKGQLDPTWYILQHYVYQLSQDLWRFLLFWHSSVTLKKQEITCQNLKNLAISAKIHQSWPATDVQGFDSHCPKTHTKNLCRIILIKITMRE